MVKGQKKDGFRGHRAPPGRQRQKILLLYPLSPGTPPAWSPSAH